MIARKLSRTLRAGALGLIVMTAACADLVVDNPNEPDRDRALADALAVESLIAGSFQTWWDIQQGRTTRFLENMASASIDDALNYGNWDAAHEPRKEIINQPGYQWGYAVEDPFMIQSRALAAVRDGMVILDKGLQIGTNGADTPRLKAFGKLMQGLFTANIALLYDKGWIVDEKTDTEKNVADKKLVDHKAMMTQARAYLNEARQLSSANFTTPANWAGQAITSARMVQIINSYEARFLAAAARTPAERAAVDWNRVLTLINTGVTADFGVTFDGPNGIWTKGSGLKATSSRGGGVSPRIAGPADQSGKYQAAKKVEPRVRDWYTVETDDRRIHAAGDQTLSGAYLELEKNATTGALEIHNGSDRGNWHQTPYASLVWRTIAETSRGFAPDLSVKEMNLLKAEALIRLNRAAEALPLINATRVANGRLPPVTVDGDKTARCVPRRLDRSCGNLMDALVYEKRLETLWLSGGLSYFDARGWGIMLKGTAVHFPVPALELNALPLPLYTFGGQGDTQNAAPDGRVM